MDRWPEHLDSWMTPTLYLVQNYYLFYSVEFKHLSSIPIKSEPNEMRHNCCIAVKSSILDLKLDFNLKSISSEEL